MRLQRYMGEVACTMGVDASALDTDSVAASSSGRSMATVLELEEAEEEEVEEEDSESIIPRDRVDGGEEEALATVD